MTDSPPFTTDDLVLGSSPRQTGPGRFVWHVPDGWQQGRGAFGGLVLAAVTRALAACEPEEDRVMRSFNGEIAGPVLPGDAEIEVTELRRGSGLSAFDAIVRQKGQGVVRGSAIFAKKRATAEAPAQFLEPPVMAPWNEVPAVPLDNAPFVPAFSKYLEFRLTGGIPYSGARDPIASGWIRMRRSPPTLGAPEIVALADAWWPSALTTQTTPRAMGTVAFGLQYLPPSAPLDPSVPLCYRGKIVADQDGYMVEMRELWTPDGRLLALNQQTLAWIR